MHKLLELRDMLMDELEQITDRGQLTEGSLGIVQKITHSIKSIDTIIAMEESSRESRDGYSGRRYRDGSREGGTSGRRYRDGSSGEYSGRYRDGGTSGRRRRDSMGRYADGSSGAYSGDGYSGRYSRDEAKDKMIEELEGMMGDVSPQAQKAIEKAIHALDQE